MAVFAWCFAVFRELPAVHVLVTIFAIRRGAFEKRQGSPGRNEMTCFAIDSAMSPE